MRARRRETGVAYAAAIVFDSTGAYAGLDYDTRATDPDAPRDTSGLRPLPAIPVSVPSFRARLAQAEDRTDHPAGRRQ